MTEIRPIRVDKITDELDYPDVITAMAIALEEVCIAEALVLIHGPENGAAKYVQLGGRMRSDTDGAPVLLWFDGMESRL